MGGITDRLKHAWNAFAEDEKNLVNTSVDYGTSYGLRPHASRTYIANDRSIISSIYNRIGIDVAAIKIQHVKLDENQKFVNRLDSGLNDCLNLSANIDQGGRAFRQDIAMTLFDKGVVAIVPVETDINPNKTGGYDIKSMRVGEITQWYPEHVRVALYNEKKGIREEIVLSKSTVAIVENPLYNVMNEPNSTLQRLIRKLSLLDSIDEQVGSGKLDLIIQLPYVIKSDARKKQAEQRRKDIEVQLKGSQYGIAYTDGTERITQLNRPAENNMLKQVEYLTGMLYAQLGLTEEIFNGTADERTMLNYHNRTVEPIVSAIVEAMKRTFLTKTARSQRQSIEAFRDPFKMLPISDLAEIADKFTRNEIMTGNEIRSVLAMKQIDDPAANELRNKNIPAADQPPAPIVQPTEE